MGRALKVVFGGALVILFVFLVVARIPAEWGAWAVTRSVPHVKLGGVSGTLWDGKARAAMLVLDGHPLDLGGLEWNFKAMPLLIMNACVDVRSARLSGDVCRGILTGSNAISRLMLDQLPARFLDRAVGAQLTGFGSLTVQEAEITDKGQVQKLAGTFIWQGAKVNYGDGWLNLGSYSAELSENGKGGVKAEITDTSGDFEIRFSGEYGLGAQPVLNGTVKPRSTASSMIINALSLIAEADDSGSYRITWPMGG